MNTFLLRLAVLYLTEPDDDPLPALARRPYNGAMMFPPSLSADIKERAFVATNGELGVLPSDTQSFLRACRDDGVEVLGWEFWVVDHVWGQNNAPVAAAGSWCGGIPLRGESVPAIISGTGDADDAERQIAAFDLDAEVLPQWVPLVRVNFTLNG
jgi:hypothetical protein